MVRLLYCITRRTDLPLHEFRRIWTDQYVPLLERSAGEFRAARLHCRLTFETDATLVMLRAKECGLRFDATVEVWWESGAAFQAASATEPAQARNRELLALEDQFVDRKMSTAFFTED